MNIPPPPLYQSSSVCDPSESQTASSESFRQDEQLSPPAYSSPYRTAGLWRPPKSCLNAFKPSSPESPIKDLPGFVPPKPIMDVATKAAVQVAPASSASSDTSRSSSSSSSGALATSLIWMHASPLAGRLKNSGGVAQRIEELDLEVEREVMTRIFDEHPSSVSIRFEIATIESVGDIFRKYKRSCCGGSSTPAPVLHLSCHAAKSFLALEDGMGGIQHLTVAILRQLLQNTGIKFVFIAACCSRSIGELFEKAGVDHVICTASDNMKIQSAFFLETSKELHKCLLSGQTVNEAFMAAKLYTSALGCFEHTHQELCLIGNHVDHEVPIFASSSQTVTPQSSPKPETVKLSHRLSSAPLVPTSSSLPEPHVRHNFSFLQDQPAAIRYNGASFLTSKTTAFSNHASKASTDRLALTQSPKQRKVRQKWSPRKVVVSPSSSPNQQETFLGRLKKEHAPPLPPRHYVRCDDEKFQIIRALNVSQIVWITGKQPKCGKSTVVQASLSYLKYRLGSNKLDNIFWSSRENCDEEKKDFATLLDAVRKIPSKRVLVAIEAKSLPAATGQKLAERLHCLVEENPSIKILVIHQDQDSELLGVGRYNCNERSITVGVLNAESIVKLFAKCCPHVSNEIESGIHGPETLWELLAPQDTESLQKHRPRERPTVAYPSSQESPVSPFPEHTARMRVLIRLMGGHIPLHVMEKAKRVTVEDYRKIICLGGYLELDNPKYESHNGLLKLQLRIARAMIASVRKHLNEKALALQMQLDCIDMVKGEVKSLREMKEELKELENKIQQARKSKQMDQVVKLFNAQKQTWKRLQSEIDAVLEFPAPFMKFDPRVIDRCCTRQCMMEKLLLQVHDVFVEAATHHFRLVGENQVDAAFSTTESVLALAIAGDLEQIDCKTNEKEFKTAVPCEPLPPRQMDFSLHEPSVIRIQCSVRRMLGKQKLDWFRLLRDLKVASLAKQWQREIHQAREERPPLSTIDEKCTAASLFVDRAATSDNPIKQTTDHNSISEESWDFISATRDNQIEQTTDHKSISEESWDFVSENGQSEKTHNKKRSRAVSRQSSSHTMTTVESTLLSSTRSFEFCCNGVDKPDFPDLRWETGASNLPKDMRLPPHFPDLRWETGAYNLPKDMRLPSVRRYSPPPDPQKRSTVRRIQMERD